MLTGLNPILTGELLAHLDAMGHSDAVVVADAHFPAERLAHRLVQLPALSAPEVVRAIRTVLPLDDAPSVDLMRSADKDHEPVQNELIDAAGVLHDTDVRFLDRHDYYDLAASAFLIIRSGETRKYGNVMLRKGLVGIHEEEIA